MNRCPGQDTRYWKPEDVFDVPCPVCDTEVEFFKTDGQRTCGNCGYRFINPHLHVGCAQWCEHAEECLGYVPDQDHDRLIHGPIAEQLVEAIKEEFGDDYGRIAGALNVLRQAQALLKTHEADPRVVTAAAILHAVGTKDAVCGPGPARRMMQEAGLEEAAIERVCSLLGDDPDVAAEDTPELGILRRARQLAETKAGND